jgi:hypothetical protein
VIAVVSHDAGGAEILSSWLRSCQEPYCLVLGGPAKAIFQRKLDGFQANSLPEAIGRCDWVLCGTSWQSNLEKQAIALAKSAGKRVVAFLDHWVNYAERFQEQGNSVYPDEIWVGDVDAERIASTTLPEAIVVLKSNPYFEDLQRELVAINKPVRKSEQNSLLYVCEPVREHSLAQYGDERYWGYTEEDAFQYFLENIDAIGGAVSTIKIRPHPSERKTKYDWVRQAASPPIEIGGTKPLLEEIVEADVVVGCESMAMVVGLLAKKRVISTIPPGGKKCGLPQDAVEHLQDLVISHKRVFGD